MSSLLIAWQLKDKNVLIVGGGEVASQRVDSILPTGAHIALLAPSDGLNPRTRCLIDEHSDSITYYDRRFSGPDDLIGADMVLTALDDVDLSRDICNICRTAKIPVNAADIPDACDFYFGSQIRDGPLQIMISTNGNGPKMANIIKERLQKALSGLEGQAITKVGALRALLKIRAPGVGGAVSKRRMKWMSSLCNAWTLEELVLLDDAMMQKLLDVGWENDRIPTFEEVGGRRPEPDYGNPLVPQAIGFIAGALLAFYLLKLGRRKWRSLF
ncbi:Siroheme biosynthesis protein met8 [Hypsizygus marmoreus]|uniref:precorrin-2 dehydrogenase n=1 Tax=Hypsizygus marmoreus TaxID=39966 RepID=A0A369JGZ1_HYPMA|nr:Siroheme biosynthesis protein met8 [Hypsizygus marmoreus]